MSRTEFAERLEQAAGTPPDTPDLATLWQRGRRRRRTKRIGTVAAAAVLAATAVIATPTLTDGPGPIEIDPADTPQVERLPQVPLPDPTEEPDELPVLEESTDSLLILTRDGSASFVDVDRRQVEQRQMDELAPGDPIERLVVGERLVLYGGDTTYVMDPRPDADPEPLIEQPSFSVFVDAGVGDRVWVRPGRTDGAPADIVQVGTDGTVLHGPTESPGGNLAVGLRDTVVLQRNDELVVWDPVDDEVIVTVDGPYPMGTDGRRFAWCDATCQRLYVTDATTGTTDLLAQLPDQVTFAGYAGRISPNGRYLATPMCHEGQEPQGCALTVLDLDHDRAWTVADGHLPGFGPPAWSPDSRWVFAHLTDDRLAAFQPGQTNAALVDIDPTPRPYGFGATSSSPSQ